MKGATGTETPYSKRRRPYLRPSKHCSFAILNNAVHVIQGNQITRISLFTCDEFHALTRDRPLMRMHNMKFKVTVVNPLIFL